MLTTPPLPSALFVVVFTLLIVATAVRVLRFPDTHGRQVLFRLMLVLSVVVGFSAGYGVAGAPMAAGSIAVLVVITRRSQRKHWDASDFRGMEREVSPGWEPPPRSPIDGFLTMMTGLSVVKSFGPTVFMNFGPSG